MRDVWGHPVQYSTLEYSNLTHGFICSLSTLFRQSFNQKHKQSSDVSFGGIEKRLIANDAIKTKFLFNTTMVETMK